MTCVGACDGVGGDTSVVGCCGSPGGCWAGDRPGDPPPRRATRASFFARFRSSRARRRSSIARWRSSLASSRSARPAARRSRLRRLRRANHDSCGGGVGAAATPGAGGADPCAGAWGAWPSGAVAGAFVSRARSRACAAARRCSFFCAISASRCCFRCSRARFRCSPSLNPSGGGAGAIVRMVAWEPAGEQPGSIAH